jgi:hypothetical protein
VPPPPPPPNPTTPATVATRPVVTPADDVPGIAAPLASDSPIAFSPDFAPNDSSADGMFSALAMPGENNSSSATDVPVGDEKVGDDCVAAGDIVVATVTADAGDEDDDDEPCPPLKPRATDDDDDDDDEYVDDLAQTITLVRAPRTSGDDDDDDEAMPPLMPGHLLGVDDDDDDDDDGANEEDEGNDVVLATSSNTNQINNNNVPLLRYPSLSAHDDPLVMRNQLSVAAAVANVSDPTDGDTFAKGTTNHTRSYTSRKKKLLTEFVDVLKSHPSKYARFLEVTTDLPPLFPTDEPTEMVFLLLRGEENKAEKVRSLNKMIIDWVTDKRLKNTTKNGSAFPAPSSINTMIRTFFAAAKDYYQWSFSQKDFNFDGGYNGFFAALCKKRRNENVSASFC